MKKYVAAVCSIIICCVILSGLVGFLVFRFNSLKGSAPYDFQGPAAVAAVLPSIFALVLASLSVYFFLYIEDPYRKEAALLRQKAHIASNDLQLLVTSIAYWKSTGKSKVRHYGTVVAHKALEDFVTNSRGLQIVELSHESRREAQIAVETFVRTTIALALYSPEQNIFASSEEDLFSIQIFIDINEIIRMLRVFDRYSFVVDGLRTCKCLGFQEDNLRLLVQAAKQEKPDGTVGSEPGPT